MDILVFHQTSRDNFLHYLNEEEIKRYDQFHFVSDKELYILSRILLKTALKDINLMSHYNHGNLVRANMANHL